MPDSHPQPRDRDRQDLPAQLLELAIEAALAGTRLVVTRGNPVSVTTKSSTTDLVTEVDRAAERAVIDAIRARRPDDAVLAEEGGTHGGTAPEAAGDTGDDIERVERVRWVIDPIDGTVNFVLGLPGYAVSVAAELESVVVAGCVVDAGRAQFDTDGRHVAGDVFWAQLGGGSFRADGLHRTGTAVRPLRGPRGVALSQSVVGTGFSYDAPTRRRQGAVLAQILEQVANIRRLGSAALDLCYVASGQLDAYFEAGTKEWDRAAGMLIASEAGVGVGAVADAPFERCLVAASAAILEDLTVVLAAAGAHQVL